MCAMEEKAVEISGQCNVVGSLCKFIAALAGEELWDDRDIRWLLEEIQDLEQSLRFYSGLVEQRRREVGLPRHQF